MGLPVRISCFILLFSISYVQTSFAESCAGKGTVFVYGNGMFNSYEDAREGLKTLKRLLKRELKFDLKKQVEFELAYKTSEPILQQLLNVMSQKKIDDFQNFWLWVGSTRIAPSWFIEAMISSSAQVFREKFEDLKVHFENYASHIREGFNVILISHSQGNLYANQAMKDLERFTDSSLTGSIADKRKENPYFPKFSEIFSNVQVATPANSTVNLSPWLTFKDDLIIQAVRSFTQALAPSLDTPGSGSPPNGDFLGHNFIKAYLANPEASSRLVKEVQSQYDSLRYPIRYFEKALLIEDTQHYFQGPNGIRAERPDLDFSFDKYTEEIGELRQDNGQIIKQTFLSCFSLRPGVSKIEMTSSAYERLPNRQANFDIWPDGKKKDKQPEKRSLYLGPHTYEIGTITTKVGKGKSPIDVEVKIFQHPNQK
jgi:hypothetical protein